MIKSIVHQKFFVCFLFFHASLSAAPSSLDNYDVKDFRHGLDDEFIGVSEDEIEQAFRLISQHPILPGKTNYKSVSYEIDVENKAYFLSKIPWYDANSCEMRASHGAHALLSYGFTPAQAITVWIKSKNSKKFSSPVSLVSFDKKRLPKLVKPDWEYHVALFYPDRFEGFKILDPAVSPQGPIMIDEWLELIKASPKAVSIELGWPHAMKDGRMTNLRKDFEYRHTFGSSLTRFPSETSTGAGAVESFANQIQSARRLFQYDKKKYMENRAWYEIFINNALFDLDFHYFDKKTFEANPSLPFEGRAKIFSLDDRPRGSQINQIIKHAIKIGLIETRTIKSSKEMFHLNGNRRKSCRKAFNDPRRKKL